jgi:hypothetical protein
MGNLVTVKCCMCEAVTVNGYVCSGCEIVLQAMITRAGITDRDNDMLCLLDELDVQMSRQARMTSRFGGASAETPMPYDARAAKAHSALSDVLTSWARHYGARGGALAGPRRSASWLRGRLPDIMTSVDVEVMHADLTESIARAVAIIDRKEPKDYVGVCSVETMEGPCRAELYAPQETPTLTCPVCGTVHDVKARRSIMLDAARDLRFNATDLARITCIYGGRITPDHIYKWKHRGRLIPRTINMEGQPLYRLGDVLELAGLGGLHFRGVEG